MEYVTITDPGKTTFKEGEVISREAFDQENKRVTKLGEKPATGNNFISVPLITKKEGGTEMMEKARIIGDKLQAISDEVAKDCSISKCQALAIVGGVLLDEGIVKELNITPEVVYEVKKHIAAACTRDTDIIFKGLEKPH